MPDVFDQIGAPSAAPQGDVFDHIASHNAGTSPKLPAANATEYLKTHPTMDSYAVQQAFLAAQGKVKLDQPTTAGDFAQSVANAQGGFTHFGNAMGQAIANPVQGAVGLVAPQTGMHLRENNVLQYGPQTGVGGFLGAQAGGMVNMPYVVSPVGQAISAASAAGNERINVAQDRTAGKEVGGFAEARRALVAGGIDYGSNVLANKIGSKVFGSAAPALATTVKDILATYAKKFGANAITNEVVTHATIAAQNLNSGRPVTEGMGAESLIAPLVQTAAMGVTHGGENFLKSMRERHSGNTVVPSVENTAHQQQENRPNPGPEFSHGSPSPETEPQPAGQENRTREEQPQPTGAPDFKAELPQDTGFGGRGGQEVIQPHRRDLVENVSQHTPDNRLPGAATEPTPKTQPDNRSPFLDARRQAGGETEGERRVLDAHDRKLDASGPIAQPNLGDQRVFDAMDRAADRGPDQTAAPAERPGQRLRDQDFLKQENAPKPENPAEHPQRLNDVDALTDWYNKQNPNDSTGDLIKTMAPHTPYVQADVPIEHVKPLSDGQDVDRSKIDAMKKMTPEQRRALGPAIVGPDGEVFDGNHRAVAAQEAGDTHLRAFVPEDAVGKNGIKALSAPAETPPATETPKEQTPIQQLLAKGREAQGGSAEGQQGGPKFGSPEWAASMKRATADFKQRGKYPNARPGFISIPDSKFAERDVKPAAEKLAGDAVKSLGNISRALGTGATWSVKDRDSANHVSQALAEHDRAMAQAEHELAPHREVMEKWSDKAKAQWVDQVEATGHSPDPKLQAAADFNNKLNEENIKRGKLVGINTKKWEGDYIGRLAEFPDDKGGEGTGRSTLAGPQNFLKGRVFDTFSEFKKFVEDHGGKLKYDNPMDMLLAKQGEVQKSIAAREAMYREDNHGQLKWVPDGEKPPEGFTELKDPLAQQERRQILPSSMVARIAQMDHYAAKQFLEGPEVQKASTWLRPGTDLPKGYSYSGEAQPGTYHGNENVANIFNNLISPGLKKNVPVLHQMAVGVRGATSLSLNLSGAHYLIETLNNAGQSVGRAITAATSGDMKGVRENLKLVNPLAANKLGRQAREQYADPSAHPQLESKVQSAVEGGGKFSRESVLDKNYMADAKKEWAAGNKVGAGVRVAKHIYDNIPIHHYLFHEFVPNLKAAAAVMSAGQAEAKGLTGDAKQRYMAQAHDDIENNLGMVQRNRQFQNKVISDAMDVVLMAPKYVEGRIRNTAAAGRDSLIALRDVAQGKRPILTPAMATAAGHMATHAAIAALTQIAYTTATTGKPIFPTSPMDFLKPRTGRKDDQGRDERLTIPTPISTIFGLATKGGGAITSRIAPVWHTLANELSNVDEHNVEIRHKGDSIGKQMLDSAKYAVRGQAPFALQNIMEGQRPGQPHGLDKTAAEAMGIHASYTAASSAEQEARQALFQRGRANPLTQEQYDRQQERGRVAEEFAHKDPKAVSDLADDLKSGKLTQSDRASLMKQRKAPEGLSGELKKMQAEEIMDRVWPKMTADEKSKNQWLVRGMIGRSTTLTGAKKQELWAKIKSETAGGK